MQNLIAIAQIVFGILLIAAVYVQVKGNGFGRVWGGLNTSSSKRGLEGILFKLTFVLAFAFTLFSTIALVV